MNPDERNDPRDLKKTNLTELQRHYIESLWSDGFGAIRRTENQLLNWLFAVHAGGIAGLFTLVASTSMRGSESDLVMFAVVSFTVGLVLLLGSGTTIYYGHWRELNRLRGYVRQLSSGELDWGDFVNKIERSPDRYRLSEWLAWISAFCAVEGLACAAVAII